LTIGLCALVRAVLLLVAVAKIVGVRVLMRGRFRGGSL
jgi:hypothetical protein